jgi:hypothetical protein
MDGIREVLDGEAERRLGGFDCSTAERQMFVPFSLTRDPATALAICRERGLLLAKLDRMTPLLAGVAYATTLATALLDN